MARRPKYNQDKRLKELEREKRKENKKVRKLEREQQASSIKESIEREDQGIETP